MHTEMKIRKKYDTPFSTFLWNSPAYLCLAVLLIVVPLRHLHFFILWKHRFLLMIKKKYPTLHNCYHLHHRQWQIWQNGSWELLFTAEICQTKVPKKGGKNHTTQQLSMMVVGDGFDKLYLLVITIGSFFWLLNQAGVTQKFVNALAFYKFATQYIISNI